MPENEIFEGIDFDASGNLFGYTSDRYTSSSEGGSFYSIDTTTGAATLIGNGGLDSSGPGPYPGGSIVDINSYNPFDDKMYAVQLRGYAQYRATILYTIDMTTGFATKIGEVSPFGFFLGELLQTLQASCQYLMPYLVTYGI